MNLSQYLEFEPTKEQNHALIAIADFISEDNKDDFFILLGYAGTGKTTITKAIINGLQAKDIDCYVTAPTGRATKIISEKSGCFARTIHSQIYKVVENNKVEHVMLEYRTNDNENYAIFIVDEASMVSDTFDSSGDFKAPGSLLSDLIRYVKQGNLQNKLIFIGDDFQLPPIDVKKVYNYSPALSSNHLIDKYSLKGSTFKLTEVKRQESGSKILEIATSIRESNELLNHRDLGIPLLGQNSTFKGSTLALNSYVNGFDDSKIDKQVVVCYTNNDVAWWNNKIREKLGYFNQELVPGDIVTIQRSTILNTGTLLKGEIAKIIEVASNVEIRYGQRFADITVELMDLDGPKNVSTKVLLDTLYTHDGRLSREAENFMTAEAHKYNPAYRSSRNITDDIYLSALRLRHAYAITCNKAQGGEWDNVYLHNYQPKEDAKRWLYTAVTRARKEVYSWAA
jgi:exodeoxyribonuclease-5